LHSILKEVVAQMVDYRECSRAHVRLAISVVG